MSATKTAISAGTLVHRTMTGQFWHLEQKPGEFLRAKTPADLLTACGRRLGRFDMVEAQPVESISSLYGVCESCVRKAAQDPKAWLPAKNSLELERLQRSIADRIENGEDGIQCATGERDHDGWFPDSAIKRPQSSQRREEALEQAAQQCGSRLFGMCPAAKDCALAAMARGEEKGIWGGVPAWALREARRKGPEALEELLQAAEVALENALDNDDVDDVPLMTENNVRGRQLVA